MDMLLIADLLLLGDLVKSKSFHHLIWWRKLQWICFWKDFRCSPQTWKNISSRFVF